MSQHPEHGARFELRRTALTDDGADYAVTVRLPAQVSVVLELQVGSAAAPIVSSVGTSPADATVPEWVAQHVATLGKQLAKGASYPRLFQRWREAPTPR